ncbi:efflux RND transporter periplasmic adaptor subunit [Anatilimnocola floriformis]|uniref:efflux RND transporter periplasmic adaptor subunit n=1 Tax=Anatilimnocola floriformis TaxID=2948575 RepID=UPI0020C42614|nr:efflux RND transporter periplasmic adaptor subunit [Anatilimnocola floriformis]
MIRNAPVSAPPSEAKSRPAAERRAPERTQEETLPPPAQQPLPAEPSTQHSPIAREAAREPKQSRLGTWITLAVLAIGAGAGWYYRAQWWPKVSVYFAAKVEAPKGPRVVPVVTATATTRDFDLYLNGLGTVTALKTATIRSRVDGELISVPFEEGEIVEKGTLLAQIDSRPFEVQRDQAAGQLARDEATLKTAKNTLERYYDLFKSKGISKQELENQESLVHQTEGMVKSDRAMVANAELQITYCRIISPFKGRIGLRLVDVGNIVRANDPSGLAVMNQLEPIAITFTISQDEIPRVQARLLKGDDLQVEAYDRDFKNKLATGTLLATDNQVDATTGTLRLKAIVDKDAGALFPNQFVNTRLLVDTKHNATIVPSAAVQRGPTSNFVYVVQADSTVELRDVIPGPVEGTETSIEKGLKEGEVVVTEGLDKLQPKAKVTTRDAKSGDAKAGGKDAAQEKGKREPKSDSPAGKKPGEPVPAAK